jgi:hypothetical protein
MFPILDSEKKWSDDIANRDTDTRGLAPTAGLSQEALDCVRIFQAFQPGDAGELGRLLFKIHRVSNKDKHQTLHAALPYTLDVPRKFRIVPEGYLAIVKTRFPPHGGIVENGAHLADVKIRVIRVPPEHVKMTVKFEQSTNIGFTVDDKKKPIVRAEELPLILAAAKGMARAFCLIGLPDFFMPDGWFARHPDL